jgi:HSP20 family protein
MLTKKESAVAPKVGARDPFAAFRHMTSELERMFDEFRFPAFASPSIARRRAGDVAWSPVIDVFERDNRMVTKADLPGVKKEDLKVEVFDGHLAISGERKSEVEEKKQNFYRSEREYGTFYRMVPLPEGVKLEDVKANFADGVLEVSVPLPKESARETVTIKPTVAT